MWQKTNKYQVSLPLYKGLVNNNISPYVDKELRRAAEIYTDEINDTAKGI